MNPFTMAMNDNVAFSKCLHGQSVGLLDPKVFINRMASYHAERIALSKCSEVQSVHDSAVNDLDIDSAENRHLLSGSANGSIAIHDLEQFNNDLPHHDPNSRTFKLVCSVMSGNRDAHRSSIETVQWYPLDTGIFTSSGTDRTLKIWDANRLQTAEEYSFNGIVHCHQMSGVASKHNLIAVGTESSVVKLVDPRTGSATHSLRAHKDGAVRAVCWSTRDEFILATGGVDNFAMLWDVRTAKGYLTKFQHKSKRKKSAYTRDTTHDGSVNGLAFTANGLQLLTLGTDQKAYLWDTWTGSRLTHRLPNVSHIKRRNVKLSIAEGSENFAFIPTGSSITSLKLNQGGRAKHLYGHYNNVNCCVYHGQGNRLLSGGNDHKILVWSLHGDTHYYEYLCDKRKELLERKSREEATEAELQAVMPEAMAQTLDTWSDEDEGR